MDRMGLANFSVISLNIHQDLSLNSKIVFNSQGGTPLNLLLTRVKRVTPKADMIMAVDSN